MRVLSFWFIVFSKVLLVTFIFSSHWFIVSRNGTTVYFFGTFTCQGIEDNDSDLKMTTHLNVLKTLLIFCLLMHIVLIFQMYLVRKCTKKLIIITQNIPSILLLATETAIITLFLKNILFHQKFTISWSFYVFCGACFICLIIFLTHAIKSCVAYENSTERDSYIGINGVGARYMQDSNPEAEPHSISHVSNYLMSKFLKYIHSTSNAGITNNAYKH